MREPKHALAYDKITRDPDFTRERQHTIGKIVKEHKEDVEAIKTSSEKQIKEAWENFVEKLLKEYAAWNKNKHAPRQTDPENVWGDPIEIK